MELKDEMANILVNEVITLFVNGHWHELCLINFYNTSLGLILTCYVTKKG